MTSSAPTSEKPHEAVHDATLHAFRSDEAKRSFRRIALRFSPMSAPAVTNAKERFSQWQMP